MANETILIVEDEADILELLRYNLNREGYHVLEATTGEAALDIIRKSSPIWSCSTSCSQKSMVSKSAARAKQ